MTFPLERPARLAVFASGRGSNLRALAAAFPLGDPFASVVLVVSNKRAAGALSLAEAHGVPAHAVPFGSDRGGFEREADALLTSFGVDLVCLAGFMRVLSPAFTARYAGRILQRSPVPAAFIPRAARAAAGALCRRARIGLHRTFRRRWGRYGGDRRAAAGAGPTG